jgi:predicted ATPase
VPESRCRRCDHEAARRSTGCTGCHHCGVPILGLYGRESEMSALDDLLDGVGARGGAVIVRGEPGIGKSALLRAARRSAEARGMDVLRATGAQSEAQLPFAGLHQFLQPLLGDLDKLPARQRAALEAAFGLTEEAAPDRFLIALATLELLGEAAERAPLLLIAEDCHWLDRSTNEVLAFNSRRLSLERIVALLAVRSRSSSCPPRCARQRRRASACPIICRSRRGSSKRSRPACRRFRKRRGRSCSSRPPKPPLRRPSC